MKFGPSTKIAQAISHAFNDGCKTLRERAALAAQAMCSAEVEHDYHDEEEASTVL